MRTLMLGLDGVEMHAPVVELALRWGKRFDALVVGCVVLDEPGARVSEAMLLSQGYSGPADEALMNELKAEARETLDQFRSRCAELEVRSETLFDSGSPADLLLADSHRFDMIMLGRHTHFEFGHKDTDDSTLVRVLKQSPRPVVMVPCIPENEPDGPVLITYDGSPYSARALYDFVFSGLGAKRQLHVLSIDRDPEIAAQCTDHAVEFLRHHDLNAISHPFDGAFPPLRAIMGAVDQLEAALLVIGAHPHSPLREFFWGSTTQAIVNSVDIPVFSSH